MDFEVVFFTLFFCVAAYFGYAVIRHRGFKGAMFGATVLSSVGEVSGAKRFFISQKIKVHILGGESPTDRSVGLEFTSSGPGSWSMTPLRLSTSETRRLISLLEEAIARGFSSAA